MRTGRSLRCLFCATLYCLLYLVSATDDDLVDFDFADLKEIDWNYDNAADNNNINNKNKAINGQDLQDKKLDTNMLSFDEDDFDESLNQVRPFDWREKVLRTALSKALTNGALRQKFVEVMPILRVLSSQQRLALSALISAQINARKGHELKLDQVRTMFGNDKNLLVPIVYDIANLVHKSARNYLNFDYALQQQQQQSFKRNDDLNADELQADEESKDIGVLSAQPDVDDSSLEDFFVDMPSADSDDILDPQAINEELTADIPQLAPEPVTVVVVNATLKPQRHRRAVIASPTPTTFVHKLIRSVPLSVNEDDLKEGVAGQTIRLNTTAFRQPQAAEQSPVTNAPADKSGTTHPAYYDVEDLAFASLNGTTLDLNANDTDTNGGAKSSNDGGEEPLPSPEELIAGPRYRISGNKLHFMRPKMANRKRVQVRPRLKGPPHIVPPPVASNAIETPKKCERFTASMCIRTEDYPLEQIMGSIRRHKNAMSALLAEYHDKTDPIDFNEDFEDFPFNKKRREDDVTGGSMCQSIVRYARPQKARSASGEWKYIVNTGQHTQTLRLEKCTTPMESCSYLAQTYRSHCAQVYNYHRLLSWDKSRGLHVDIFKVPTCCSCQVDGYRQLYPPLDTVKHKDYTPAYNTDSYGAVHEEFEYTDESEEDDLQYALNGNYNKHSKPDSHLDANELFLGSKKVRTKAYPSSNPTVGSFLSPPEHEEHYEPKYSHRHRYHSSTAGKPSSLSANTLSSVSSVLATNTGSSSSSSSSKRHHRRPYKSLAGGANEARVDLEFSPSEHHTDKEVNLFGTTTHVNAKTRAAQKRKRIYSVPHTSAPTTSFGSSGGFASVQVTPTAAVPPPTTTSAGTVTGSASSTTRYGYRGRTTASPTATAGTGGGYGSVRGGTSSTATITNQIRQSSISNYQQQQHFQQSAASGISSGGSSGSVIPKQYSSSFYAPGGGEQYGRNKTRPSRYYTAAAGGTSAKTAAQNVSHIAGIYPSSSFPTVSANTPPTTTTTESIKRLQSSTPSAYTPSLYQLNSIYSSKFNSSVVSSVPGAPINGHSGSQSSSPAKRINYSYHPIIDFFENHKPQYTEINTQNIRLNQQQQQLPDQERLYPYTITKSTPSVRDVTGKERRIGFGASGGGGNGGGVASIITGTLSQNDNSWHPVLHEI